MAIDLELQNYQLIQQTRPTIQQQYTKYNEQQSYNCKNKRQVATQA